MLVVAPGQLNRTRVFILVNQFAFLRTGQRQTKIYWRVCQRSRRVCAAVAYLERQDFAVKCWTEERFGNSWRGTCSSLFIAAKEVKENSSCESPAFICPDEVTAGNPSICARQTPNIGVVSRVDIACPARAAFEHAVTANNTHKRQMRRCLALIVPRLDYPTEIQPPILDRPGSIQSSPKKTTIPEMSGSR